jgi:vacuolar-type H+-ATPase subunit E/Vma4
LGRSEDEHRANARTNIAAERREAMRAVLLAKTRVVERVLERARTMLPEVIESDAYRMALTDELERSLAFVESEETVARCREALAPALRVALRDNPKVTVQIADNTGSGFVLIGEAGRVRVDSTLETRLDRLAPTLGIDIHNLLEER